MTQGVQPDFASDLGQLAVLCRGVTALVRWQSPAVVSGLLARNIGIENLRRKGPEVVSLRLGIAREIALLPGIAELNGFRITIDASD